MAKATHNFCVIWGTNCHSCGLDVCLCRLVCVCGGIAPPSMDSHCRLCVCAAVWTISRPPQSLHTITCHPNEQINLCNTNLQLILSTSVYTRVLLIKTLMSRLRRYCTTTTTTTPEVEESKKVLLRPRSMCGIYDPIEVIATQRYTGLIYLYSIPFSMSSSRRSSAVNTDLFILCTRKRTFPGEPH